MKKNYTFNTPIHFLTFLKQLLNIVLLFMFLLCTNVAISQKSKGKKNKREDKKENKKKDDDKDDDDDLVFDNDWNWDDDRDWKDDEKKKKLKKITLTSCIMDMGNGMYRVNFGYVNPNNKVVRVKKKSSYVVIKRKGKKYKKNEKIPGVKKFLPGEVKVAFFIDFYDKESVEWRLKFPKKGKKQKTKVDANSPMCPEPPVIIPVYGQEGGKSETPLGLELTSLAEGNAGDEPSPIVYQITGTGDTREVLLEIVPKSGRASFLKNTLQTFYNRLYLPNDPLNTDFIVDPQMVIDGNLATFDLFFPINQLLVLSNDPNINFIRPLYTPIRQGGTTTTQGDGAMFTDLVRESFVLERDEDGKPIKFVNGEGVKIGVISDSFDKQPSSDGQSKASADVGSKDLPGTAGIGNPDFPLPVDVRKDYPYGVASDEGRAMLQLIHDVAPGAELAFSTGVLSPRDFALAIKDLANVGCDVIVDDVTYPFEPFFGEGQISQAIKEFTKTNGPEGNEGNEGHAYFTSAGNFANRGYQGMFKASTLSPDTNIPALETAKAHVFSSTGAPEDIFQGISVVPGTYMIVLQWDEALASQDNSTGAGTDLDIFLVDDDGNFIVGNNRVNINGDAAEVLVFEAIGTGTANILITSPTNPGQVPFRYIAFRTTSDAGTNGLQFTEYNGGAPTVSGHAMTPEAITVGAVFYQNALNPTAEPFSSSAGTLVNSQTTEVDIAAPDGGNTNVASVGQQIDDGDGFPNFFGTSAAAPHAAAAFALLKSALPSWYPEGGLPVEVGVTSNLIADQLLQLFKSTAVSAGSTETAGSGLINAEAALRQIASQTAILEDFTVVVPEGGAEPIPGSDTFDVTISGQFIPAGATVLLGDQILDIVGDVTDTQITATVVPFVGNPDLTVLTNSELPGAGKSNGLNLLPDGKIALNIIADDIEIEFGQSYEFTYRVEGLPEETTYEDTGLPEIVFTSPAVAPFPDVNNYAIFAGFGEVELTEEQLAAYQINFIDGLLTVVKKDLLIKPVDETIAYGEGVDVILNYEYDVTGIDDNATFLLKIEQAHEMDFFPENTIGFLNRARSIVNDQEVLQLLNQGGSWISSERTIINRARSIVNGTDILDLGIDNFLDYINDNSVPDETTGRINAVINRARSIVNSEDLIDGLIDFQIQNRARSIVNSSGLGGDDDFNNYSKVFAIIDEEDIPVDEDPTRSISAFYSLNLISGLSVTEGTERHYIYPGGFLNNLASNFNVTYGAGRLSVESTSLFVQTPNVEIDFGVGITKEYINSLISPVPVEGCEVCPASLDFDDVDFKYDDTIENVFADPACVPDDLTEGEVCSIVIPYYFEDIFTYEKYFIDEGGLEGLMLPVGIYFIKINDTALNYTLDFGEGIGRLTISNKELTVSGNYGGDYPIVYGDFIVPMDLDPFVSIDGLDEGEFEELFPNGIQYYLVEEELEDTPENRIFLNDEEPPLLPVGRYIVKISLPDESSYTLIYVEPLYLWVSSKTLFIEIQQSAPVFYGENTAGVSFNIFIDGLVGGDTQGDIFPGGIIPNYFEAVNEVVPEGSSRTRFDLGDPLEVGEYFIRVDKPENYSIIYGEGHSILTIDKAILFACIAEVEIRNGETLFPDDITLRGITGFVYGDALDSVFPLDENFNPVITYLVNGEPLTEAGLLLDEGTYTITIQDDDIINYIVDPDSLTCSATGKVVVTTCGDATSLDFSDCTFDEFAGKYRFADVAPGLDALVTIQTQGTVQAVVIDNNEFPDGSEDRKQFRPSASFTITDAVPEPYVEFSLTLVNGGTNTPATEVEKLIAGVLDVDGTTQYQEYVEVNLPSEYMVEGGTSPTQLGVIENPDQGLLRINGYNNSYTAAFNSAPRVNVEVVYDNVSSLIYRVGAKTNGTGNVNVPTRQYGIQFACLTNFNSPVKTTVEELGSLMAATTPENECVVYNNPVGPAHNYILSLEPKEGVSGEASVMLTNMKTMQSYSFGFGAEQQFIQINMEFMDDGLYIVQTSIGSCQSDGFIVVKN